MEYATTPAWKREAELMTELADYKDRNQRLRDTVARLDCEVMYLRNSYRNLAHEKAELEDMLKRNEEWKNAG